jgi:hypothetical protein
MPYVIKYVAASQSVIILYSNCPSHTEYRQTVSQDFSPPCMHNRELYEGLVVVGGASISDAFWHLPSGILVRGDSLKGPLYHGWESFHL